MESLASKRVAVDASLWLYHFLKAMRDPSGNLLPNAFLLGFFRRVAKLLFYNIKPIFVFDGGVPALKKQTIAARRQRREGVGKQQQRTNQRVLDARLKQLALATITGEQLEGTPSTGERSEADHDVFSPSIEAGVVGTVATTAGIGTVIRGE